ncbi:hypothetical protein BDV95DRAFT_478604 [Massariosphaeria phaeospora]|uniref:SPT23/MGA2-like DNA-binding domain-containing protein n=1 Tax=Massariosphaeria phaeospora TaxID=100035 RepID=A0A7C8IFF0_9PLEO|nr:hypothetical protein BDV95DRAFT_478604 [Massariosphaeria phaeospora]
MKVTLILDPLDSRIGHIQFPRTKLAKAKQMATREEEKKVKNEGNILRMEMVLVCATAIQQPEDRHRALRRAAGVEPIPRRCPEVTLSDMEKTDPARPQNGGEVVICANCKERERKRNDRKKKRTDDEEEWDGYGDHRIIMINEKQYKEFKPVETSDLKLSPQAKQVDFAMRIACYCRHQEDKSPVGYRVIFTFKDSAGQLVAQCVSDTLQVTDDHKNKEGPERPRPLTIPPQPQQDFLPMQYAPYTYGMGGQYPVAFNATSQPASPLMPAFQSPISPMQGQFSPVGTPSFVPVNRPSFSGAVTAPIIPQYVGHQQPFSIPMTSPTSQVAQGTQYIPRVHSMSSFNFTAPMSYAMSDPVYHSEPASASGTPYNLSRPASPQWEQNVKKKPMLGYGSGFY